MAPQESQTLAALVHEARRQSPAAPDAWLENTCTTPDQLANARTLTRVAACLGSTLDDDDENLPVAGVHASDRIQSVREGRSHVLGHYEILQRIGAGGMGEVFRARDLALGRQAALKLLPRQFASELRMQLVREAEACSRLQHPAIATFYEAGDAAGETFIAMEYVDGPTLRRRCEQGPIPLDHALSITKCLLEALEHAHAAGILHCDVKPENVITPTNRSAKLLDFGIARHVLGPALERNRPGSSALEPATSRQLAGTIGYMAPEQLRGDPLDARTDVFQAGVILYEMVTGQRAFRGSSLLERLASVLTESPDLRALSRPEIPADLVRIVSRAVTRDRTDRYVSAAAFLRDLEDLAEGRFVTALPTTIAVVDFDNLSGEQELDWIAGSTAERIRTELARVPTVGMVPREKTVRAAQSLHAHGDALTAAGAGLLLGCRWIVSGRVERLNDTFRVTIHLTETATSRVMMSDHVDGTLDELLEIQQKLAGAVMETLGVAAPPPSAGPVQQIEAEECFARARLLLDRLAKGSVEQALELLERAVSIDPEYVPALAGLAWAYGFRSISTTEPIDLERSIGYAERAINLDPRNSEAHMWRGYVLLRRGDYGESARACGRAAELGGTNATASYFAGSALLFDGRSAEALPYLQRSLEMDGKVGMGWLALGAAHLSQQHLLEAHSSFSRALNLEDRPVRFPTAGAAAYIGEILRLQGQVNEAREYALQGLESAERSDHAYRDFFRAHALVVLGRTALDQGDVPAALAAFRQVLAQAHGRPQTRSCGQLVTQALAGLARATRQPELIDEAQRLFDAAAPYNFEPFFGALDEQTLFELAGAAHAIGQEASARVLLARARSAGSRRTFKADPALD